MKAVVNKALEKYGRLDIMFANADIAGTNKLFKDIEAKEFMKTIRTNVLRYDVLRGADHKSCNDG